MKTRLPSLTFALCTLGALAPWTAAQETPVVTPTPPVQAETPTPPAEIDLRCTVELPTAEAPQVDDAPLIQLAILLDTSGSMSGLIAQAKSELWRIVNEFALSKLDGKRPNLHVALYEYGKSTLSPEEGYVRQIQPLTDDLDKISEELFALTTNGGEEWCGWVIRSATTELAWSDSKDALKVIFIAGNEPFDQGSVPYKESCAEAIAKGILVNTIFCGPEAQGVATHWKAGSVLADGNFLSIDHNQVVAHIPAPQDKEIEALGIQLNTTYIPYGELAHVGCERQQEQDSNALSQKPGAATQRAVSKASTLYTNSSWDLVDAVKGGTMKLEELKKEDLPEELRKLSTEELANHVAAKQKERGEIQKKINELNDARRKFVAEKQKEQATAGAETLDSAIIKCVREQAQAKNFKFES